MKVFAITLVVQINLEDLIREVAKFLQVVQNDSTIGD
jgi:hypothetical protein